MENAPETKPAPTVTTAADRTVPYDRFQKVNTRAKELEAERETLVTELETIRAKAQTADSLAAALEEAKNAQKSAAAAWAEERALLSNGITDPEEIDLVRYTYGKVPADARPKTIAEYLTGLKTEGATIPKALAGLGMFAKAAPETTTTDAGKTAANRTVPKAGGDGKEPEPAGAVTAQAIRNATLEFQRTGDRTSLTALLKAAEGRRTA